MIANAVVDIWAVTGIKPILKYEDDLNIFWFPVKDGPFVEGEYCYSYDRADALRRIESLGVPWYPEKGTLLFSEIFIFIGMLWDHSKPQGLPP